MKPLSGIKVLDLTDGNPYASNMFAEYGADVVKIEKPIVGDAIRRRGAKSADEEGIYQLYHNRGKRSMVVDLDKAEGQELVRKLVPHFDVLIANVSEAELAKKGLDYPTVKALNNKIIYGILTAFGEEGPWKDMPDYDLIVTARSAILDRTGFPEKPTRIGFPLSYHFGGWFLVAGVLSAYLQMQTTGEGQKVSTSSWQTMFSLDDTAAQCLSGINELPKRLANGFPTTNPTDTFKCKNGWFSLSIGSDAQWLAFSASAGRQDWIDDPRYNHDPARSMENYFGDLDQQLRDYFETITIEEADQICRNAMVPGGPCNTITELVADEQVATREMILKVTDKKLGETLQLGRAAKFLRDDEDDNVVGPAPELGEHTKEVLVSILGMDDAQVEQLQATGVVAVEKE